VVLGLDLRVTRIFVKPGATDMRKAINGLALIVEQELELDPFSAALFLFCNRERRIMKALYWHRNGFCLWQKRLEKHRFPWPESDEEAHREIDRKRLSMLLAGIDFWHAHEKLSYENVG
jgi:transposase